MMLWLKSLLALIGAAMEWLRDKQLIDAGKSIAREQYREETIKKLKARDTVKLSDVDKWLRPPEER